MGRSRGLGMPRAKKKKVEQPKRRRALARQSRPQLQQQGVGLQILVSIVVGSAFSVKDESSMRVYCINLPLGADVASRSLKMCVALFKMVFVEAPAVGAPVQVRSRCLPGSTVPPSSVAGSLY